jgi:hypothetical protein
MNKDEALKLALEALDIAQGLLANSYHQPKMLAAYTAVKQALAAQPEQEPMSWHEFIQNQKKFLAEMEALLVKTSTPQRTEQEPVFRFQMQLQDGWGGQYPKAIPIGDPDFESLFKNIGDIVTFYAAPPQRTEQEQWGASAVTHPEYVAEQKRKTEELRSMLAEPVAFAGVKIWVGDQQVVRLLTQTELNFASDPCGLLEQAAGMCIEKLKGAA